MPTCEHRWCERGTLTERSVCHAHYTNVRCELKACNEWAYHPYTTCKKHSALLEQMGEQPTRLASLNDMWKTRTPMSDEFYDFRFSASYASRYNGCHGSANLTEAIPGFEHPERNEKGMKGEGTRLHKIFEIALSDPSNLRDKAELLDDLAGLWGPHRTAMLNDEKKFIITWFLKKKVAPPFEIDDLKEGLLQYVPEKDTDGNDTGVLVAKGVPPRRIRFLAEALRYVADIVDDMDEDSLKVSTELTANADWLETAPRTTVDLIIKDKYVMHVLDLKMGEIEVSPIKNAQLMYYAWTFGAKDYDKVRLHIMQRGNIDYRDVSNATLSDWSSTIRDSEQAIIHGDLTLTPGEHCKFCPANPQGRGDKGSKFCPVMLTLLYGERDAKKADAEVLEGDLE